MALWPAETLRDELSVVLDYLHYPVKQVLVSLAPEIRRGVEEIRLRQGQPLMVNHTGGEGFVTAHGTLAKTPNQGYIVTPEDIMKTLHILTNSSLYALEEELRRGFITISGGHRVGMAGRAVIEQGVVRTLKQITALNLRVARQFLGSANQVLPHVCDVKFKSIYHTLIVSPPCCGKTTLLRDLIRQISYGNESLAMPGMTVGLVDERSEVAGSFRGVPQLDVGPRTDVLDGCPKAEGMMMLIRSMNPRVIAIDEIGTREDMQALEEALNAGVKVIATAHGASLEDILRRPNLRSILDRRIFERLIFLERQSTPGRIKRILSGTTLKSLTAGSS